MCGIAGWIDFSKRYCNDRYTLQNMVTTLTHRGPDSEGLWLDDIAALGHRRLSIIDLENGAQPMIRARGNKTVVISYCGEIFNFDAIRKDLIDKGYVFETCSDTEVILEGYFEWGTSVIDRLNGMFAIAIWDTAENTLFLIRDRMGVKPLYYAHLDAGVVFGSEMKAVMAHPAVKRRVSRTGMCEILDMVKTPELTPYDDIFEVRPGSCHSFSRNGHRKATYWKLAARPHGDDLETTILTVRDLLSDAVHGQLTSDVPICTLLSGGLDSSALTAIAASRLSKTSLASFSMDFRRNVEAFSADGLRGSADAPFARALSEHVGSTHTELLLDSDEMLKELVRENVLRSVDAPPSYWGDMWPSLYLLFKSLAPHSKVALSGEAADEVFGGYQWFRNPAATKGDTFPWLTPGSSRYFGGVQLLSGDFLSRLDRKDYREMRFQEAISEIPVLDEDDQESRQMRQVSYLALTRFVQTLLDRNDRMSMAVGVEVRVPFCDHRLVEYVFNTPWSMKTFDGREKSLLREAARPYLPAMITDRLKTPYPATQDYAYEQGLRMELADRITDPNAPLHNILDKKKASDLLSRPIRTVSQPYNRGSLEMLLWLNRWMEMYSIDLVD